MQANGRNSMAGDAPTVAGYNIVVEQIKDENGNTSTRKYRKGNFLGKGGFAKCYELTEIQTSTLFAAKIITKASLVKPRAKQKLKSEIKIHKSLAHQNVVKFIRHFEDKENIYILLEICKNKSLNDMVKRRKRLREVEARCYVGKPTFIQSWT